MDIYNKISFALMVFFIAAILISLKKTTHNEKDHKVGTAGVAATIAITFFFGIL